MRAKEGTFKGAGGLELYHLAWLPDGEPKAVLILVHGLGEHCGRYNNLVNHLVPRGDAIYSFDHRGHGRSPGPRGHVDRWKDFRADVRRLLSRVQAEQPGVPVFLFGHSMGGLIALNYVLHDPSGLRGIIASAPGLDTGGLSPVMLRLARVLSRVAPRLPLPSGLDPEGISRDTEVIERYKQDPLTHSKGTPRAATEGTDAVRWTNAHAADLDLPLLLYYGTADRLVPPAAARRFFERVTHPDKTLHEYEGTYHEPHNDLDKAQVFADIERWLEARV